MLSLKNRLIGWMEARLGTPLEYLRVMARACPGALRRMALFMPLASYGRTVPKELLHVARIGAVPSEDCGSCLEITTRIALDDGVPARTVERAARGGREAMIDEERDAWDFGRALVSHDPGLEELRPRLEARHGEAGLVELSLAVASAQLFPTVKRGMGLSRACQVEPDVP